MVIDPEKRFRRIGAHKSYFYMRLAIFPARDGTRSHVSSDYTLCYAIIKHV